MHRHWPPEMRGRRECRVLNRTRGLVCSEESTRVRNHRYAEHSGIPCAMVYGLLRDLPGVPGFVATVAREGFHELDLSVGRPGPHGFAVRIARLVCRNNASIASRLTFRDDWP